MVPGRCDLTLIASKFCFKEIKECNACRCTKPRLTLTSSGLKCSALWHTVRSEVPMCFKVTNNLLAVKPNSVMGKDGFSMEEAYRVISKGGPIETYKRDVQKVGAGQFWMYTEEYFYPRQCESFSTIICFIKIVLQFTSSRPGRTRTTPIATST